ncbi:MAG: hypothetical protein ACPGWR_14975 [Ardenticatenaceae bacterium]
MLKFSWLEKMMKWLQHTHFARVVLFLIIALMIRAILYLVFPPFFTNDSGDYLIASEEIYNQLNFSGNGLRDWRLPGYPIFLALVRSFTIYIHNIIIIQKILGIFSVILGFVIGYLLRSRLVSEILVLFLGLHPVYLLNEHLIMTETLFLFTLLYFSALLLFLLRGKVSLLKGFFISISLGICVLTRANALFFCAPLIFLAFIINLIKSGNNYNSKSSTLYFGIGLMVGAFIIFAPWFWRNYVTFGHWSLTNNTNRNLVIYQSQHNLFNPELPQSSQFKDFYNIEQPNTIYDLIAKLGSETARAEKIAGLLVREQINDQFSKYLEEVVISFLNFVGYSPSQGFGRGDIYWWFISMVRDVDVLHSNNNVANAWLINTNFEYIEYGYDSWVSYFWSKAGPFFLVVVRPITFSLFLICLFVHLITYRITIPNLQKSAIIAFSIAYFATASLHAVSLSDYDRFVIPFNWCLWVVISLVIEKVMRNKLTHLA